MTGGSVGLALGLGHAAAAVLVAVLCAGLFRTGASPAAWTALALLLVVPAVAGPALTGVSGATRLVQAGAVLAIFGLTGLAAGALARSRWGRGLLALASLGVVAAALALPPPGEADIAGLELPPLVREPSPLERVAVIGIDGGDWSVIDPLMARGELPHLQRLVEEGVTGVLHSIEPMYSPVVWTSIFSGVTPEEHGIRGWYSSLATNRNAPLLWELVGAAGDRVAVANIPGTWPPRPVEGTLLAGFPLPQLVVAEPGGGGQFLGRVVSASPRQGLVPTTPVRDGTARVPLGRRQVLSRSGVRHALLEVAVRNRWVAGPPSELEVHVEERDLAADVLHVDAAGVHSALRRGDWTPWLDVRVGRSAAFLRIRRLESGDLYVTPPFQSPLEPRFPILTGDDSASELAPDGRYVVEGVGWKASSDADLRSAVYEHLAQVQELQHRAARRLAEDEWTLLAFVYTLTDRIQHGYWPYHEPEAYAATGAERPSDGGGAGASGEHAERVRDAYREVDAQLGALLAALGDDVTVFIVSDHGAAPDLRSGFGGHREDGILVARGPGIAPGAERLDLSVYDVTPTLLAGLGLPVGSSMPGRVREELFESPVAVRRVDSFGDAASTDATIDRSTEEQLRALGYVE